MGLFFSFLFWTVLYVTSLYLHYLGQILRASRLIVEGLFKCHI